MPGRQRWLFMGQLPFISPSDRGDMPNLKVLHLSTSDMGGGAAIAAGRIVEAQLRVGIDAQWLVLDSSTASHSLPYAPRKMPIGKLRRRALQLSQWWEWLLVFLSNGHDRARMFKTSMGWSGLTSFSIPDLSSYNIVHIHWVQGGFLSLRAIENLHALPSSKVVYTLHDVWCSTGVCHLYGECRQFRTGCSSCPMVKGRIRRSVKRAFERKQKYQGDTPTLWVALSQGQMVEVQNSQIRPQLGITRIPNPIDTDFWTPSCSMPTSLYKREDRFVLLFVAARPEDPNKGLDYLQEVCRYVSQVADNLERKPLLRVVGEMRQKELLSSFSIETEYVGSVRLSETLRELYRSSDLLLCTSRYETFGQTLIEALSCGIPVVSTRCTGPEDVIDEGCNGYLCRRDDPRTMADRIIEMMQGKGIPSREACRASALAYALPRVGQMYKDVYDSLFQ